MAHINDRADEARARVEPKVRDLVTKVGLVYPTRQLFFRVFKDEKILEVWGSAAGKDQLKKIKSYDILAASGGPGPKRKSGDNQVPEGWYNVNRFNPNSQYHLSLGLNYPNGSDRHFADADDPGGDIFIHGNKKSIGCLAMGDPAIEEIYTLARASTNRIYVLILPSRKNPNSTANIVLYSQIYAINAAFESNHKLPSVRIDTKGNYVVH